MEYRRLGRSGVRVSSLCLGTMNFGASTDEETSVRIIHQALEGGINFIDTADVYGRGVSEEIVGKALAQGGRREEIVLATKAVAHMGKGPNDHGASRYHLIRACEASLRRLKTDRIDLYQLHIVDLSTPLDEVLETLGVLVKQGKILYTGTSKWPPTLIVEALGISDRRGLPRFITEQPPYNMVDRCVEKELVWMCIRQGIGIIPWGPLAYGILTGTYRKGQLFPEGHRFSGAKEDNARITPAALEVVEKLLPLAAAHGCSLPQLAHSWLVNRPGVAAILIGPRTEEHLAQALASMDVQLTAEDLAAIDAIVPPGTYVSDFYHGNVYAPLVADPFRDR